MFAHASQPKIFYSTDEGFTWHSRTFAIPTIDSRTLIWNTRHDEWALAHDFTNDIVCATECVLIEYSNLLCFFVSHSFTLPKIWERILSSCLNTLNCLWLITNGECSIVTLAMLVIRGSRTPLTLTALAIKDANYFCRTSSVQALYQNSANTLY